MLDAATRKKLRSSPVLLAQRNHAPDSPTTGDHAPKATLPSAVVGSESHVQFACASDIVIADDPNLATLLNTLVPASQDIEIEQLYRALGSKWLSADCAVVSKARG